MAPNRSIDHQRSARTCKRTHSRLRVTTRALAKNFTKTEDTTDSTPNFYLNRPTYDVAYLFRKKKPRLLPTRRRRIRVEKKKAKRQRFAGDSWRFAKLVRFPNYLRRKTGRFVCVTSFDSRTSTTQPAPPRSTLRLANHAKYRSSATTELAQGKKSSQRERSWGGKKKAHNTAPVDTIFSR